MKSEAIAAIAAVAALVVLGGACETRTPSPLVPVVVSAPATDGADCPDALAAWKFFETATGPIDAARSKAAAFARRDEVFTCTDATVSEIAAAAFRQLDNVTQVDPISSHFTVQTLAIETLETITRKSFGRTTYGGEIFPTPRPSAAAVASGWKDWRWGGGDAATAVKAGRATRGAMINEARADIVNRFQDARVRAARTRRVFPYQDAPTLESLGMSGKPLESAWMQRDGGVFRVSVDGGELVVTPAVVVDRFADAAFSGKARGLLRWPLHETIPLTDLRDGEQERLPADFFHNLARHEPAFYDELIRTQHFELLAIDGDTVATLTLVTVHNVLR